MYAGQQAVLTTKHAKEKAIQAPFLAGLGLQIIVPPDLDTDCLGTFTGEIPRTGSIMETVLLKAQLGLQRTNHYIGIASEGSFGPHPASSFISSDYEVMVLIDNQHGFHVIESLLSTKTNYNQMTINSGQNINHFLLQAGFPAHALIVRPKGNPDPNLIYKGITELELLNKAIDVCIYQSPEKMAQIETDMRAHLNPTRRRVIKQLAIKLVRRLLAYCEACHLPGWGLVKTERGLPCETCSAPTALIKKEIYGCVKCDHVIMLPREDKKYFADTRYCPYCNP